jgi:hypothetical protein
MRPATSFGQYHVAEAPSAMLAIHQYKGAELKEVDHEPKIDVLDQEDFATQDIDTSVIVPGAPKVDALGNCVLNAGTSGLSNVLDEAAFLAATGCKSYADTRGGEIFAIKSYHGCTDQTGTPAQEWPPTDCGSSGPYLVEYYKGLKLISGQKIASGAQNLVSLLQSGGICEGGPFLNAWEEPGANAMVDGNGSASELEAQIQQGVAGGHETYISAIEKLVLSATGTVEPEKTILRVRNSWSKAWGDSGSFRIHLSTLVALGRYFDFRQFVA